jgi:hypothetical protein
LDFYIASPRQSQNFNQRAVLQSGLEVSTIASLPAPVLFVQYSENPVLVKLTKRNNRNGLFYQPT